MVRLRVGKVCADAGMAPAISVATAAMRAKFLIVPPLPPRSRDLLHRLRIKPQQPRRAAAEDVALGLLLPKRQIGDPPRQLAIPVHILPPPPPPGLALLP